MVLYKNVEIAVEKKQKLHNIKLLLSTDEAINKDYVSNDVYSLYVNTIRDYC